MYKLIQLLGVVFLLSACGDLEPEARNRVSGAWTSLFNGENLDGWKVTKENPGTFKVKDGMIVVDGDRAHLFYDGPVSNHNFTDFELKLDIMTTPNSNSGVYFHTEYQEEGWPVKGYESQVNNTYDSDPRRTASLYSFDDNTEFTVPDDEWFTMTIRVEGKHIQIHVNDSLITDYTEPDSVDRAQKISSGTFALQGHDPESVVYYRNIRVREL